MDIYSLTWKNYPHDALSTEKPGSKEYAEYDDAIHIIETYSIMLTVATGRW